jgi:hypothetical protein
MKKERTPKAPPAEAVDNSFNRVLQDHRKGAVLTEASDALRACVDAVVRMGKPATLTLKLTVHPATRAGVAVVIEDDLTTKLPKTKQASSIFFSDDNHNLFREDPRQQEMVLKTIDGEEDFTADEDDPPRVQAGK